MFIRKNKNRSGSVSVQIISKYSGKYKVIKTIGSGWTPQEIKFLYQQARQEISRLRHRIDGHICIAFAAYTVFKELERILYKEKSQITVNRAAELTHNMYQLNIILPESKQPKTILLKMTAEQAELYRIIQKYC